MSKLEVLDEVLELLIEEVLYELDREERERND